MNQDEINAQVKEAVEAAISPLVAQINQTKLDQAAKDKTEQAAQKGAISLGVLNWIDDKATDRFGGRDLQGPSRFNQNPKPKDQGEIRINGLLTGKTI